MRRSIAALLGIIGGMLAGAAFIRRQVAHRERADLYFEDGSMLSLTNVVTSFPTTVPVPAGVVCAHAVSDRLNTVATRILTNLLVIDPLDSFGLVPGYAGLYKQISTGLIGSPRRTRSASPVPGSSRRTSSVVTTQVSWV